jgi:hypothetical protein
VELVLQNKEWRKVMFNFSSNHKTINEIHKMYGNGTLIIDNTYQRRSVWSEKDKIRLIETILLNLIIPELFFWPAETDPETGESIIHIVDGQQRIKAITSFISNEFKLKKQYLMEDETKESYGNMFFKNLPAETRQAFWNYKLMIIEIDRKATRENIVNMFRRLNLTDYNLNDQEKRNSISGDFAALTRELSELPFWEKYKLFNNTDIKRMKDVEFCGSLVLLYRQGIIDQTDQRALNQAYEDLQNNYIDAENDKCAIISAIDLIKNFFVSDEILKFLKRKAQLYSLFSVVFFMQREKIDITDSTKNQLAEFVKLYSIFDNNMDLSLNVSNDEKKIFDWLKKYKLASSEGLNKHTNRMIRYNVLKDFLFSNAPETENIQTSLYNKMSALSSSSTNAEPDIDE